MPRPFGIYIHFPFCRSKCPYCGFFSRAEKNIDFAGLIASYQKELDFYAPLSAGREVSSVFFGGGTPSLLPAAAINDILNYIAKKWKVAKDAEISLEANPNSRRKNLFRDLRQAGINRLSLGVQALNEADLRFLGRSHSLTQAHEAIEAVLNHFDNHSMDLIYARPQQTARDWQEELAEAAALGFRHLSLYQLTIDEDTVFARRKIQPAKEDEAVDMYRLTGDFLAGAGYRQYEVSNYATKGFACRHNQLYWKGDDYLGIGAGAHGRLRQKEKIYACESPQKLTLLTAKERAEELLIMGLRLTGGIDKALFAGQCGLPLSEAVNLSACQSLIEAGLLEEDSRYLKATKDGFLLLDYLIEKISL